MAFSILVPRINNNDDEVKLVGLECAPGDKVTKGQVVAQIETDKAVMDVTAHADGYVLGIVGKVDDVITVGKVLVWLGETPGEAIPEDKPATVAATGGGATPTARARLLLRQHGLDAADVPASGERLSVEDVERFVAQGGGKGGGKSKQPTAGAARGPSYPQPDEAGSRVALRPDEKGMLQTVSWHRDVAAAGYIELEYDAAPWEQYAKDFQTQHKMLLSPLLSLMAWRLAQLAKETPKLNSTIVGDQRHEYSQVNLGFTVQAGETLYLCVQRDCGGMPALEFVNALGDLQRRAAVHKLTASETTGSTIAFSSMARWKVSHHVPILSPNTSVMIAHTVSASGQAVLGASYDHRVLNGFHVVSMLRKLASPPSAV